MVQVLGFAVLVLVSGWADGRAYTSMISVANGGASGKWYAIQLCPDRIYARGFSVKVDTPQGIGDDTGLNGIRLICTGPKRKKSKTIHSATLRWGAWTADSWCPAGVLRSFSLRVQPWQGVFGDSTGANNIRFRCSDGSAIEGRGGSLGDYGGWSESCKKGICGIQTRAQPPQGFRDDTGVNDVRFLCCND
ncbi:vitelline membrane outer layer protein 1 homolog [Ambystoma mexicanum]|uniref:vitelline membrane outer layer protein 1 homolog n=1 Tax=Ambystoma mexicanum TaxID=8296 RepID=UPI0037E7C7F7